MSIFARKDFKMEKLTEFVSAHINDDPSKLLLARSKWPEIDMDLAVNCIESRRKLKGKVKEWYDNPALVFPAKLSAEQCSSSATGFYKASLAGKIGKRIADLTGGLGVDSWFFAKVADEVLYNEMQTRLCDAARHNFDALGVGNIRISNHAVGNGLDESSPAALLTEFAPDLVFMDPARRGEGGKKVFLIEECTPDVLTLKDEIFGICRHMLIKLSPMADITMVCSRLGRTCREVHVVATGGECKELLIWMDREWNDEYTVHAVELPHEYPSSCTTINSSCPTVNSSCTTINSSCPTINSSCPTVNSSCPTVNSSCPTPIGHLSEFTFLPSEEHTAVQYASTPSTPARPEFIFEPGKALMKAGAFNLISTKFGITKLGKSTHYYTFDSRETAESLTPLGKVYRIMTWEPLDKRSIKAAGKAFPKAEVTARNIPMDTDTLRKKLGITSGDDAHIFGLKSDKLGNLLLCCQRVF